LLKQHHNPDWAQGIPYKWLKKEWQQKLPFIQRYILGEERFSIVHCYDLRFFMHINGDKHMNLPFYLLKNLTKMAKKIQDHPENAHNCLFHQSLIKILVLQVLNELGVSWAQFLDSLGF
jgi:hypothetical protein